MKIGMPQRVRLAALLVAVGATAFLFFGFPFLGDQAARWFAAWFDQLSSHQQHIVMNIGHFVPYVVPFLAGGLVAFGVFLRARGNRSDGQANSEV